MQHGVDVHFAAHAAKARHPGSRAIGRKLQRRDASQLALPVGELRREHFIAQRLALPQREIGVCTRQLGKRRWQALGEGAIQPCELEREQRDGPPVAHDMVHGEEERTVVVSQPHQGHPQQRAGGEIERPVGILDCQPRQLSIAARILQMAQVDRRNRQMQRRRNHLLRLPVAAAESSCAVFRGGARSR